MMPLTRIVAATDFSPPARRAVERAYRLASDQGAALQLVHVLDFASTQSVWQKLFAEQSETLAERLRLKARQALEALANEFWERFGVRAALAVVAGKTPAAIVEAARSFAADLIVVGTRGESFLRQAIVGSTAMRVLRVSRHTPVLMVKQPPLAPYRNVLVALDPGPNAETILRTAQRWAGEARFVLAHAYELPFESKLSLAGVSQEEIAQCLHLTALERREWLQALAETVKLATQRYEIALVHGPATVQLLTLEQDKDIDLIVAGKHSQGVIEEWLLGSVTKHLLSEAQSDLLIVSAATS